MYACLSVWLHGDRAEGLSRWSGRHADPDRPEERPPDQLPPGRELGRGSQPTFDLHDLEALVVVDPPIPIPQQGRFLRDGVWHTADGVPAPEPAPVPEPPKRRRVAAGEPKLRKAKPKAKAV